MERSLSAAGRICPIGPICVLLTVAAFALAAQGKVWRDRNGNMELRGYTSLLFEGIDDNAKIKFTGKGSPMVGEWKKDGMLIEARSVELLVSRATTGNYDLHSATLEGSVHARRKAQSTAGPQIVELWATRGDYDASTETWSLDGNVRVEQTDPSGSVSKLSGTKATVILTKDASVHGGVKSAAVTGPVTFDIKSKRQVHTSENPPKTELKQTSVTGKADRMDYDGLARTLVLNGNVFISGDDPLVPGDMEASKATIYLDQTGAVKKVELEGEPGVTRLKKPVKTKGGGAAR